MITIFAVECIGIIKRVKTANIRGRETDEEEEEFIIDLPIFCETHPYIKLDSHHCPICNYGLYTSDVTNAFKLMPLGEFT